MGRQKKVEVKALKRELEKAKGDLKETEGELTKAMLKLAKVEELREKMGKANAKVKELDITVEQLKNKVLNAKLAGVATYKESREYQSFVGYAVIEFLAKEKIKIRRIM